jgi:hypothetical protein
MVAVRLIIATTLVFGCFGLCVARAQQQGDTQAPQPPTHIVIPSLANAAQPSALDFEGAECDVNPSGDTMACEFQQVFLTLAPFDPQMCLITTNRYERTFQKQDGVRWVSSEGPTGECGVIDVMTLQQDGSGARWTLEASQTVTLKDGPALCRALAPPREVSSWRDVRRPLPCRFVEPGAMSR